MFQQDWGNNVLLVNTFLIIYHYYWRGEDHLKSKIASGS